MCILAHVYLSPQTIRSSLPQLINLLSKTVFVVPGKSVRIGVMVNVFWRHDLAAMKLVVVAAVFEFLAYPIADLKV